MVDISAQILGAPVIALSTLILSLLLPFLVKPLLVKLGIMDVPNERSSHDRPVPRGLGLAVLLALTAGGGLGIWLLASAPFHSRWDLLLVCLLGSIFAGLLGLGEDLRGLSVPVRSACLLLVGFSVPLTLVLLVNFSPVGLHDPFSSTSASFGWFAWEPITMQDQLQPLSISLWLALILVPYGMLFVSSYVNVANFMDGLNGISGFHGVIAGITFAAAGYLSGHAWLLLMGLLLAAAFAGFLPWNLSKPGAFLGDVGSYLLGGAVAVTSFAALLAGVPILATIGPMIIYFGDVGVTLVKRVRAGHKWDEPHKEHVYQRINQLGYSHVQASGITALFTLAASILGLVSFFVSPGWWIALTLAGLLLLALYLRLPRMLPAR